MLPTRTTAAIDPCDIDPGLIRASSVIAAAARSLQRILSLEFARPP
jgi:hypothetical protein